MQILKQHKQVRAKRFIRSIPHKHHFSSPNTTELIVTLLFLSVLSRLVTFLGRETKY